MVWRLQVVGASWGTWLGMVPMGVFAKLDVFGGTKTTEANVDPLLVVGCLITSE